jgi:hypothetical protein
MILFSIFVTAQSDEARDFYNATGGEDSYFTQGFSRFNDELTADVAETFSIPANGRDVPLVSDLNKDGIKEIIAMDDNSMTIYSADIDAETITGLGSYTMPDSNFYSNYILFDIDGDNNDEIIVAQEQNDMMYIMEWNGTNLNLDYSYSLDSLTHNNGEMMIGCEDVEKCVIVYGQKTELTSGTSSGIYGAKFNTTNVSVSEETLVSPLNNNLECFSNIRVMPLVDMTGDGDLEFTLSYIKVTLSGNDHVGTQSFSINDDATISNDISIEKDIGNIFGSGSYPIGCNGDGFNLVNSPPSIGGSVTNPLVFEAKGITNQNQIIFGTMETNNDFKIYMYNPDGSDEDQYPLIANGEGIIVSSLFRTNIYDNTGYDDFCVMGYDFQQGLGNDKIQVICASERRPLGFRETTSFNMQLGELENKYNLSTAYRRNNVLSHAVETKTNLYREIMSAYGVFEVEYADTWLEALFTESGCFIFGTCGLDLLWESPVENGAIISVDYEDNGQEDLIILSNTNLVYVDDGFTNSPGYLVDDDSEIDPCLERPWQVNTSIKVEFRVEDDNDDHVSARAILYYDHPNEQDSGWTDNVTHGTLFTFTDDDFKVNATTSGTATLRLMGRDVENPDNPDIEDVTFSVATTGAVFGDCSSGLDIDPDDVVVVPDECTLSSDCPDGYVCIDDECEEEFSADENELKESIQNICLYCSLC